MELLVKRKVAKTMRIWIMENKNAIQGSRGINPNLQKVAVGLMRSAS